MRNNSERIKNDLPETQIEERKISDIWSFPTGKIIVELPTQGSFYPEGHALKDRRFIELRSLKTEEEEILSSSDLIEKGLALDQMLQNIIVEPKINIHDLFIADKNALLVEIRKRNFGKDYEVSFTCRSCGNIQPEKIDLDIVQVKKAENQMNPDGTFDVDIGDGYIAVCKMLTGHDLLNMQKAAEKKKKYKLGKDKPLEEQLKKMVVSFKYKKEEISAELTDIHDVHNLITTLPVTKLRTLRKGYQELIPSVDFTYDFECKRCRKEAKVNIPFNVNFFWPEQ